MNEQSMATAPLDPDVPESKSSDPGTTAARPFGTAAASASEVDLEDGPLFRATIKEYEGRTSALKAHLKRILKSASATLEAKNNLLEQDKLFIEALKEAPFTEPLFTHYLDSTWSKLHEQQERLSFCMQNLLISPLQKLYDMDIKTVDAKRKRFEDVSKEYYSNLSKYLSIKTPGNTKKQKTESEFLVKKSEFDLVRFDYYTFLRDLHGGKKEQEILYHLLNHHEKQYAYYQSVQKTLEPHKEGLDQLATIIAEASREQKAVNQERHEKRKMLVEKYTTPNPTEDEKIKRKSLYAMLSPTSMGPTSPTNYESLLNTPTSPPHLDLGSSATDTNEPPPLPPVGLGIHVSNASAPTDSKFKGIRDLEQQDQDLIHSSGRKKEGFLFAPSKPIKNTNTPSFDMSSTVNWHKYWCVLSGGHLHEYSNWKKHLETHMEPIDLRFATVREARNADRRFCFEIITPNFRRMYQATSNEELSSWMATINNAIGSLLNGMSSSTDLKNGTTLKKSNTWKQARSLSGALSGLAAAKDKYLKKRHSHRHHHHHHGDQKLVISPPLPNYPFSTGNHTTSNEPTATATAPNTELLAQLRRDLSNTICADCSAKNPDWCSLNLGILICIECSGIHRSLGTHISKVRSLTLDSASFTPDIVQLLLSIGNAKSNAVWESQLHDTSAISKPIPTDTRDTKLKYIQAKYVDRSLVKPTSGILDPMKLLFRAIEHDDIPSALYAIALGANVNEPLPSDVLVPIIKKKKSSLLKLPLLDAQGNEYPGRTLDVEQHPPKGEDLFVVRYALHYALLSPQQYQLEDVESNSSSSASGVVGPLSNATVDDISISASNMSSMSSDESSTHSSSPSCTTTKSRVFSMAEFLFQNGADVATVDPYTGCLLADLIGLGELVEDEAIVYLNMKNSLRGQSPIVRSQTLPTPVAAHATTTSTDT
ncbi:uncharacterized protein ATC70_012680 [Mucor velutinosus]|uniref:Uncharacterized protein n=1 Tax=Mucor velutinosus TaxID=708070 RepID=A0AAN7D9F1_9FUNG|nr:hypothetical protein ATC70_012680 [Mucor velutinosus]